MNNNKTRNSLIASLAFGLALASPLVFAQSKQAEPAKDPAVAAAAAASAEATAQTPAADAAVGASTQAAAPAQASGAKQGWEDVDADKDGNISKDEAVANPGLSQVFAQADGDANGKLTKEEYKAFVDKNYGDKPKQ